MILYECDLDGTAPVKPPRQRRSRRSRPVTFPELFGLPTVVDLATAANAVGVSIGTAYRLVHRDRFPCVVMRPGWRYRVPTLELMKALGVGSLPVYTDDVELGADFAARTT